MSTAAQIVMAVGVLILFVAVAFTVVFYARHIRLSVGKVEAEFRPNGGSSLRDAINRLESKLDPIAATVANHEQRIRKLENPPKPRTPRKKAA
jgi:hypothetical protein